ncbi:3-mercaptopyruvate_sulfurtransferase / Thiosulfate sulfurtransferase [Hexamita inflata]|uniref:3-mercaptopyruvate sulfurtransferase / Thiosulfate sulfurtransferase n=1 Tax=Hexamita inflata TaxID=28002 RepID=A0AA86P3D8_9EUKA|nr:3-mercaptopyruvate sulfurtransferase / Thiosulfate sulfurtransferase [Hexamita inflata]
MFPTVISSEWLIENINQQDIRIFDVSFFENETIEKAKHLFAKEHIKNSTQLLLRGRDLSMQFFTKIPKASTFTQLATQQGFSRGIHAILYDRDGRSAVRVWWLFQYFSHVRVSILQGGMTAWKAKNLPMEERKIAKLAEVPVTAFAAQPRPDLIVEPVELAQFLASNKILMPEELPYSGGPSKCFFELGRRMKFII